MKRSRISIGAFVILPVVFLAGVITGSSSQSSSTASTGSFTQLYICGTSGKEICKVGAVGPGGGTIFFVDYHNVYTGFHYLEVAPSDWAGSGVTDPTSPWCSNITAKIDTELTAWSSRGLGVGLSNTDIMLKNCTSGAANLIADYNASPLAKKRDWFLPSIGGLMLISQNLQGLAGMLDSEYWSSSGYSNIGGWVQSMGHGYQGNATKDSLYHVRPVRRF